MWNLLVISQFKLYLHRFFSSVHWACCHMPNICPRKTNETFPRIGAICLDIILNLVETHNRKQLSKVLSNRNFNGRLTLFSWQFTVLRRLWVYSVLLFQPLQRNSAAVAQYIRSSTSQIHDPPPSQRLIELH